LEQALATKESQMRDAALIEPKIKINLERVLLNGDKVILELGCGPNKQEGRIGIDRLDLPGVDIVADLNDGFPYLPDHSVDEFHSKSLFEHIEDLGVFMQEIVRVLKPGGKNYLFVPHFSNPYYYSDYTHTRFMGLYTFYYFVSKENQLYRKVPEFYTDVRIRILSQKLIFQSPFRGINFLKKLFGKLVNINHWTQEFYEENLCYLFPCYGMDIVFEPSNDQK